MLRSKRMTTLLYGAGTGGDSEGVLPAITILRKVRAVDWAVLHTHGLCLGDTAFEQQFKYPSEQHVCK